MSPPSSCRGTAARLEKAWFRESSAKVGRQDIVHLAGDVRDNLDPSLGYGPSQGLRYRPAKHDIHRQIPDSLSLLLDRFFAKRNLLSGDLSFSACLHNQKLSCKIKRRGHLILPNRNGQYGAHACVQRISRANASEVAAHMMQLTE